MKNKNHLMMVGHYTIFSDEIAELLGNDAAILLAYLSRKKEDFKDSLIDEFFYNVAEDIEKRTHLTRWKYETALEKIINEGFVETKTEGVHFKKYFKINDLAIKNKIEEMTQTRKITLLATNKVLCKSLTTTNKDIKKYHVNLASQDKQNPPDSAPLIRKPIIKQSNRRDYIKKGLKETLVKNKNDREEKRKLKLVRSTTFEIDLILDYWSKKGLFVHKEGTKSYAEAIDRIKSLLKGTLFNTLQDKSNHNRKFSMDEIKRAIDNYCLAAFNDDYEPMHKKFLQDIRLVDFFYTTVPVSKEEYKSTFLKYLLNKPTLIANSKLFSAKDLYPNATKIIIAWYKKTFGNRDEGKFTLKNRNDIVFATQALNKFYTDNKDKINIKNWTTVYNQTDPTSFLAVQMTRAMDKALRENENMFVSFTTAWLKSEKMFNERMPSFLHKEHMMR